MSAPRTGELVWIRDHGQIVLRVYVKAKTREGLGFRSRSVQVAGMTIPWIKGWQTGSLVYRHPIELERVGSKVVAGPVFAILAGNRKFTGSRSNFRDIMQTAKLRNQFVYVLPTENVNSNAVWHGFVRTGHRRWISLPCPRPEAIYNRIPNRALERTQAALSAKDVISKLQIPMFNPDYFNKSEIYGVLRRARLGMYLPRMSNQFTYKKLQTLMGGQEGVYIKPTGGSVGHGIIRVLRQGRRYEVAFQKNYRSQHFSASSLPAAWRLIQRNRLPGKYVLQGAIPLIRWRGSPCDFRILMQKRGSSWHLAGAGVRVAGDGSITTHVPSGGYIVSANQVLSETFGDGAEEVAKRLKEMVLSCARAIDQHYSGQLGEMSMDIGIDHSKELWFFEANAKPMKFDEHDIRRRSLIGVVNYLEELRSSRPIL